MTGSRTYDNSNRAREEKVCSEMLSSSYFQLFGDTQADGCRLMHKQGVPKPTPPRPLSG